MTAKRLRRRPIDVLLSAFYSISVLYGLLFNLPEALGIAVSPESPWPPLRWLYGWAVAEEPAHLMRPLPIYLRSAVAIDGFVHAPFLLVLIYALVTGKAWIRLWAMLFAGSSITNMYYYLMHTLLGEHPPPNTLYYLAFNLPWLLMPMLLAWRMRKAEPFG
jgi:hypothetical protein